MQGSAPPPPGAPSAAPAAAPAAAAPKINKLVTHVPAAQVSAEFKAAADAFPLWDSITHPQKPAGSGKFLFDYNGDYDTERVLILSGKATLTPTVGLNRKPIAIGAGDSVWFHHGFACAWHVTEPMTKKYVDGLLLCCPVLMLFLLLIRLRSGTPTSTLRARRASLA